MLGIAAAAEAGPLDPKQLSADTTWVVHVDVDALRTSTVVNHVYQKLTDKWKDVDRHIDEVRSHLGIDPRKDLHSLTLSGPKLGDELGVLIVQAEVDRKLLQRELAKYADYKSTAYGPYRLESWTHTKARGRTRSVTSAFWKPTILVFGGSPSDVELALDVLDGKRPNLADRHTPLAAETPKGAILVARAAGLGDATLPCRSPLVKQSDMLSLVAGEHEETSFLTSRLVTKSPETAVQVKRVLDGVRAMGQMQYAEDAEALKMIDRLHVEISDKTVTVDFRAPAAEVWTHLQKAARHWMERSHRAAPAKPQPEKK